MSASDSRETARPIGPIGGGLKLRYEAFPHTRQQIENLRGLAVAPEHHAQIAEAEAAFAAEDEAYLTARRLQIAKDDVAAEQWHAAYTPAQNLLNRLMRRPT